MGLTGNWVTTAAWESHSYTNTRTKDDDTDGGLLRTPAGVCPDAKPNSKLQLVRIPVKGVIFKVIFVGLHSFLRDRKVERIYIQSYRVREGNTVWVWKGPWASTRSLVPRIAIEKHVNKQNTPLSVSIKPGSLIKAVRRNHWWMQFI